MLSLTKNKLIKLVFLSLFFAGVAFFLLFSSVKQASAAVTGDTPGGNLVINGTTYTITGDKQGVGAYNSITVKNGATLNIIPDDTVDGAVIDVNNDVLVTSNSRIIPKGYYTTSSAANYNGRGVTINAANVTVDSTSKIDASGQGYTTAEGPGAGVTYMNNSGTGGTYGGRGAQRVHAYYRATAPSPYGLAGQPIDLGSGGGSNKWDAGGPGGGAIRFNVGGTFLNNGKIVANGYGWGTANFGAGGSGGSIFVNTSVFNGSGRIAADGGPGSKNSGGGGRVAIYYDNSGWLGAVFAKGGPRWWSGLDKAEDGSVLISPKSIAVAGFYSQKKLDGTTVIATGGSTNETGILLSFRYLAEAGSNTSVFTPEIEFKFANQSFDGITNIVSGAQVTTSASSYEATVIVPSGSFYDGNYHWRARFKDAFGNPGPWAAYGNNPSGNGTTDGPPSSNANTDFSTNFSASLPRETTPLNLTATTDWDAVNGYKNILSWQDPNPNDPAPKYHVYYYAQGMADWQQVGGETITSANFVHNNLLPGKTYYYRVFSVNNIGEESPGFAAALVTTSGGVTNATAVSDWSSSEGYHVHLNWENTDILHPPVKYHVYVSSDNGSSWTQIGGETIISPSFKHLGLSPGLNYQYRIFGVNSTNQESADYAYAALTVTPAAGEGGNAITLQYGLDGYSATQDTTIYKNYPTLTSGSQSYVQIRTFDGAARSLVKFDMTGQVPQDATIVGATLSLYYYNYSIANPGGPLLDAYKLTATNSWQESTANWNNIGNGGSWVASNPAGAATNLPNGWVSELGGFVPPAWTNFDVTQITQDALDNNNGLFNVIVKLDNEAVSVNPFNFYSKEGGGGGPGSKQPKLTINYTSATIPPKAPSLSNLISDFPTQINADFVDNSTNEDDFHVYAGTASTPTVDSGQVNSVSTNGTGKTYNKYLNVLSPNTKYFVRVKAHKHSNGLFSSYSNELFKYTLANEPTNFKGQKEGVNKVKLNWDANSNPAGTTYEIYYGNTSSVIYAGTDTTFTHTTSASINTYKVRAKNNEGIVTNWSSVIEVTAGGNPHANYTQDPQQCAICHSSHTATLGKLLRGPKNAIYQADFCYNCHDGTGSIYNVKAAVDGNPSHHPIKDAANPSGTLDCISCHDPHGKKKPNGSYFAKLLRSRDGNGNKFYEGNEFCGACHGVGSTLVGGDHLSIFNTIPHNTKTPTPLSGSKIKCLNCHANNNSSGSEGSAPHGSDNKRITKASEENLCFLCHNDPANSVSAINIMARFSATPAPGLSNRHNVNYAEQIAGGSKLECTSCHNPHKNDRTYKVANPDNTSQRFSKTVLNPEEMASKAIKGSGLTDDASINEGSISNDGIGRSFSVGKVGGKNVRGILKFNLSSLPAGAHITQAMLTLTLNNQIKGAGNGLKIEAHRATEDWIENEVTWTNRSSANAWASPGGAYDSNAIEVRNVTKNGLGTSIYTGDDYTRESFDITSLAKGWYKGTYANNGLLLVSPDAEAQSANLYRSFYSSDYVFWTNWWYTNRAGYRPTLLVEYYTKVPSSIVDTASFCLKCHDGATPPGAIIPASTSSRMKNFLDKYKGGYHGAAPGPVSRAWLKPPYRSGMTVKCNDCHDPHGSKNRLHLKSNDIRQVCLKCHQSVEHHSMCSNVGCHTSDGGGHGFENKDYFKWCTKCHRHGSERF